jgi:hypothetical protein
MQTGGSPLAPTTRKFFEPRFGADFSHVRVHTDATAARTASTLSAKAFTVGRNIAFAAGQFSPGSQAGKRLLAHELTHVVQQAGARTGSGMVAGQTGDGSIVMRQATPAPAPPVNPPSPPPPSKTPPSDAVLKAARAEVVELKGHATFDPSAALAEVLEYQSPTPVSVPVKFGTLASGRVVVRKRDTGYVSTEDPAMIDMHHPAFPGGGYYAPPRLQLSIVDSVVKGHVQFFPWDRVPGVLIPDWLDAFPLQRLLGWKGLDQIRVAGFRNELAGGALHYDLTSFNYRLDGEWEGTGKFSVSDENVTFAADTDVQAKGVAAGKLPLKWAAGHVFGSTKLSLALAPVDALGGTFAGSLEGSYSEGVTNITGTVSYRSKKLNGSVTVKVAPWEEAVAQLATHQLGDKITPVRTGTTKHVIFGWGVLDFHFNDWLSGHASVIVDPEGYITSYGVIAPAKVFEFLKGDKLSGRKPIGPKFEATAFKPIWGPTGVTGTIAGELTAAGRIGPGRLHEIQLSGRFSTNPAVPLEVALTGVVDLSAIGRLELSLTGSLAYTLLGPHLRTVALEVKVLGTGTLRVYARLEPTFSVEKPKGGDPQFRINGVLKTAADVSLGLSGSIKPSIFGFGPHFKTGKYEWHVGGIGIKSTFDYRIGEPEGPSLEFEEYKYNSGEFHRQAEDLLDDAADKDTKKHETEKQVDEVKSRPAPGPKPPPKKLSFSMRGTPHQLWIETDPTPTVQMASNGARLGKKLHKQADELKKAEKAATGDQQELIKTEESAVNVLLSHMTDVESSAAAVQTSDKPLGDVAGLQELATELHDYGAEFQKSDVGVIVDPKDQDTDKKELLPGEGLVGSFKGLQGPTGDDVTPHHLPQDKYMEFKLEGNPGGESWDRDEGVCMNMYHPVSRPRKGRHFYTRSYAGRDKAERFKEAPLRALNNELANVRSIYQNDGLLNDVITDGIEKVRSLNLKKFPKLFSSP